MQLLLYFSPFEFSDFFVLSIWMRQMASIHTKQQKKKEEMNEIENGKNEQAVTQSQVKNFNKDLMWTK